MRTVTKEIKFEAAHRLVGGYPGRCAHNHGHSWVVFVTVALKVGHAYDEYGFVVDFAEFKPLRNWIDEKFDHATIISQNDEAFLNWLIANKQKHFVMGSNPTSEHIAELIFNKARELFKSHRVYVSEVRIKETCTSEAVYSSNVDSD